MARNGRGREEGGWGVSRNQKQEKDKEREEGRERERERKREGEVEEETTGEGQAFGGLWVRTEREVLMGKREITRETDRLGQNDREIERKIA